ncbi:hypothetical protein [Microseira sp. BLCC-F43]|jgi:hypothetical protein|uniref:hypothetical protein n=1 Tax=Microseira sp. BLCC-F43 TaxID=3153602 RepID=UPI0035BB78A9
MPVGRLYLISIGISAGTWWVISCPLAAALQRRGGFINTIRPKSKISRKTRPYDAINHTSPILADMILR